MFRPVSATHPPRIAVDARMASDAGVGTYISNLLPRIAERRPAWQLTILGDRSRIESLPWPAAANVEIRECRSRIYTVSEQIELVSRCPPTVDLFWSPNYNIPLAHRGRLMVTVHDVAHLAMPEFARGIMKQAYARTMLGAVRRRADLIVCDTQFTRAEFCRLVGEPTRIMDVVHLGVDERWRNASSTPSPRPRPYIVFVGNVKPHKNLGALLEAFAAIKDSVPHDLVIVGRREGLRTADRRVETVANELGSRVEITGEVPIDRLRAYVGHAAALVSPSLYEGFGFPPLEAMAASVPAIVSRIPTHQEVCGDAVGYFDPRDAQGLARTIKGLLADGGLQRTLKERGTRRVAAFTWDRCAVATIAAMERTLTSAQ